MADWGKEAAKIQAAAMNVYASAEKLGLDALEAASEADEEPEVEVLTE